MQLKERSMAPDVLPPEGVLTVTFPFPTVTSKLLLELWTPVLAPPPSVNQFLLFTTAWQRRVVGSAPQMLTLFDFTPEPMLPMSTLSTITLVVPLGHGASHCEQAIVPEDFGLTLLEKQSFSSTPLICVSLALHSPPLPQNESLEHFLDRFSELCSCCLNSTFPLNTSASVGFFSKYEYFPWEVVADEASYASTWQNVFCGVIFESVITDFCGLKSKVFFFRIGHSVWVCILGGFAYTSIPQGFQ
jgi:hypothetical protein